jgi:hypothetical protein
MNKKKLVIITIGVFFIFGIIAIGTLAYMESSEQRNCKEKDGSWIEGVGKCLLLTADAGKDCTSSSQCQTVCVADEAAQRGAKTTGECYGSELFYTCVTLVEDGTAQGVSCFD